MYHDKLVDVHAHLYLTENMSMEDNWRLKYSEKYGIDAMIVSVLGSWGMRTPVYSPDPSDFKSGNRKLYEFIKRYSGKIRIYGYITVNQAFEKEAIDEIKKGVEQYGFVGLKILAPFRCIDPSTFKVVEKALAYDIPILIHTYHKRPQRLVGQNPSDSKDIASLSKMYPEAKIIMAHIGGGGDWEYAIKAVKNSNVLVDTGGSGCDFGMIEKAIKILGEDRVLFGTDLNISTGIAKFLEADITEDQRGKIAWKNAIKIFGGVKI